MKTLSKLILIASFLPSVAFAAATQSVMLPTNPQNFKAEGTGVTALDLIKEILKQNPSWSNANLEIQLVRVEGKSGLGGAQVLLRINREYMDSAAIDTDPDQLNSASAFQRVELRNISRGQINEAALVVQSYLKINSIEVVLGPVSEVAIIGKYAEDQANVIGGNDANDRVSPKPDQATVDSIMATYYTPGVNPNPPVVAPPVVAPVVTAPVVQAPVASAPVVKPAPVVQAPPAVPAAPKVRCLQNRRSVVFCPGDIVKNLVGEKGVILSVDEASGKARVQFTNSGIKDRKVDDLKK